MGGFLESTVLRYRCSHLIGFPIRIKRIVLILSETKGRDKAEDWKKMVDSPTMESNHMEAAGGHRNNKYGNPKILVALLRVLLDSLPRSGLG